ncbi:ligand-gated channel protein [Rhodanobacter sp. Root480]|uniref:TonB-dependent vitamin B12 receptor n=1 Tax=Rhodanobacter ginsenosidimutans TaxID=490571 RepID=A0ABW0JUG7_9GAMM|nr:TonB-dependent vitamin B12 receptor [Rhodanobacter sp. Root480]KQX97455.1 ligand-gated channel protein [Rhodanobacter sp. Root480]
MSLRVVFFRQSVLAAALLSFLAPAFAAAAATDLDQMVVTASRTEQAQQHILAAVTVIDRAEIDRLQPHSLIDLLRGTPGMSLANNGGPGKSTSMFLRGTESDHVLVLVDGVRIGSATAGGAAIQDIPVDQIERIEIVRGPFSSLYGSEALGGVIQIFTRRPEGAFSPHASLGVGSDGEQRVSAGMAGRSGQGWYSINAAHEHTDGINVSRCKPLANGDCPVIAPDRDGYRNNSLTLQGGYRFNEAWDGEMRLFRAAGRNEYDGTVNDVARTVQQVAGARLRYAPTEKVSITANLGRSADLSDNYLKGVRAGNFDTRRDLGSLQADVGMWGGLFSAGYDWQRDRVGSDTAYAADHRINHGVFGQWQQSFGTQSLQASVRRDANAQFGGKTTGSALWGWEMNDTLRLTASYGTAYKTPTFNELYFPGYGNPDLGPETSRSAELGLRGSHGWGQWSLNGFDTRIDHLIAYNAASMAPANIDRARVRGVELATGGTLADWIWRTSATWLDPRDVAPGSKNGNVLPRRARRSGRIDLDRQLGDFSIGGSLYGAGERYDDLANRNRLGGYALGDLRIGYAIDPAWNLCLSLNNLFDRHYETARYYNQPGRNYLLTLNYRPAR